MRIRLATINDAASMLAIYGQYIETPITFEYVLPSVEEFARRVETIGASYPWLIAEKGGIVIGYAYGHALFERAAYQWNAELSIYISGEMRGLKIGTRLYRALIGILRRQNALDLYARITVPNIASESLHEAFAFRKIFLQPNAGFKSGQWHDVAWYLKTLGPHTDAPAPFRPIGLLAREEPAFMSNY